MLSASTNPPCEGVGLRGVLEILRRYAPLNDKKKGIPLVKGVGGCSIGIGISMLTHDTQ